MDITHSVDLAAVPAAVPSADWAADLLGQPPVVINVGLEDFANELADQGVDIVHVAWAPPAGGDTELADLLSRLGG